MSTPKLDLTFVRTQFPAFAEAALQGRGFFENAGGSYACAPVIDRLTRFYRQRKVQPYGVFPASCAGGEEMDEARVRLAALLGVETDELSFGPSTSANSYVLAQAFRRVLEPGDAIVVTDQDHEANSGVWRRLAEDGIELREWRIDAKTGHLDPAALRVLLADGRVRLVCFPHCSNVIGEINPVAEIVALVHDAGAVCCVDGVSYAPHGLPDVGALGADIYLFSAYKTYGPHQGIMVVRRPLAERLPNQAHWFNAAPLWKRFVPAGPDHAQVAACCGMADYVDALHDHHFERADDPRQRGRRVHDLMRGQEIALLQPLLTFLEHHPRLRLLGPSDAARRAPTIALALDRPAGPVAQALAARRLDCGAGHFYAQRPLAAMGVDPEQGVLRLSFVHYTSAEDVARLIGALDEALAASLVA